MILGHGMMAKTMDQFFYNSSNVLIFASGVSNSVNARETEYKREENLLLESIIKFPDRIFIYFSSCALVEKSNLSSPYYFHKKRMEDMIKQKANKYLIIRLPQVIGRTNNPNTLINYFVQSIMSKTVIPIFSGARRYVIDVNDVALILHEMIKSKCILNQTINIANPIKYTVLEIVEILGELLKMKPVFEIVEKIDEYDLSLDYMKNFCESNSLDIAFGKSYLNEKLEKLFLKDSSLLSLECS